MRTYRPLITAAFVLLLAGCTLDLSESGEEAADRAFSRRSGPTAPTNLQVTGKTSYSVSLAWSPSRGGTGSLTYRVRHSWGYEQSVAHPQTTWTWTGNLEAGGTYSFTVYAVDSAGRKSGNSNTVTVTLPRDTIPPSSPTVTVDDVGPTHVTLSWSSTDDGPYIWYTVYRDGSPVLVQVRDTSATIGLLSPETTYTFTVQARDFGANLSPLSEPAAVTTEAADAADTTAPTPPGSLRDNGMSFPDGETWLFWDQSTDNVDPQAVIRYDVFANGLFDHSLVGRGETILYGTPGADNTYEVVAVDSAGNRSAPATLTTSAR